MKTARFIFLPLLLLSGLAMARLHANADPAPADDARAIRAQVLVDGETMFWASTSDNGHPNVDEVWAYLPDLHFEPRPAYLKSLGDKPIGSTAAFKDKNNKRTIELSISYGGRAWLRELTLEKQGAAWRISTQQVETQAPYRWIPRRSVEDLCQAKSKG